MRLAESDKLLKIKEGVGVPVKLSEVEEEKFNDTFEALKGWLDDAKAAVIGKNRDEAYRYVNLLIAHLQMVDVDYIAGVSKPSVIVTKTVSAVNVNNSSQDEDHEELSAIKNIPVVRPTVELVDGWLGDMNPQVRSRLTRLLDCFKQYLDPESEAGIDIICNHCNPTEISKCLIIADPSIQDSSTVFMKHQLQS